MNAGTNVTTGNNNIEIGNFGVAACRRRYPVAEKNNPTHITIPEVYANAEAYEAHSQTPHFLKYKNATKDMLKSLELVETIPLVPEGKASDETGSHFPKGTHQSPQ